MKIIEVILMTCIMLGGLFANQYATYFRHQQEIADK